MHLFPPLSRRFCYPFCTFKLTLHLTTYILGWILSLTALTMIVQVAIIFALV